VVGGGGRGVVAGGGGGGRGVVAGGGGGGAPYTGGGSSSSSCSSTTGETSAEYSGTSPEQIFSAAMLSGGRGLPLLSPLQSRKYFASHEDYNRENETNYYMRSMILEK